MQHVFFFFTCFDLLEEKKKTGGSVLLGFTEIYDLVLIILKHFSCSVYLNMWYRTSILLYSGVSIHEGVCSDSLSSIKCSARLMRN